MNTPSGESVKKAFAPIDLTIEVTKKCPLDCLICSSEAGLPYKKELSTSQIKKVIKEAKELGTKNVCFSGGEPFEQPDIVELCQYAKSLALEVHVYTSGNTRNKCNLLCPISEDLLIQVKDSIDKIIVGLQGPNAESHESITRVRGSFENAISSIEKAAKNCIPVEIHFVPVRLNYKLLPEMVNFSKKTGIVRVSVLRFVPQGRGKIYSNLLSLNKDELLSLKNILASIAKSSSPRVRIGAPFAVLGVSQSACTAGENRATIRADGLVFPCEALKQMSFTSNNLNLQNLKEIWENSQVFRDARNFNSTARNGACSKCNKFERCRGGCPAQSLNQRYALSNFSDPYCFEKEVALIDVKL
ncbi:MAG: radical SAM protein [Candidatus Bathyarchaeia archaeon]|jgi:radical SAM protein with 4Fe4S-binding SPASM domain